MKKLLILPLLLAALLAGGAAKIVQDQCGPFTDVTPAFCPYILELYYLGITAGTSATTFSPDDPLTRGQGAVFIAKGLNQSLARSSHRAALGQWWTTTPQWELGLGTTSVGTQPLGVSSDGADLWIANQSSANVSRVRASDGKLLETWTGVPVPQTTLATLGRVFVLTGGLDGGSLYAIDPSQPPGDATLLAEIGNGARSMAFDGSRLFISNGGGIAHDIYLSIVTPGATLPWAVQKIRDPDHLHNGTLLFDGRNVWEAVFGEIRRLDANGGIVQAIPVGEDYLGWGTFDGKNLWIPDHSGSIHVVNADTGVVVSTLTGNGVNLPYWAAFDGERILVTDYLGNSVSLWRAADLSPLGTFPAPPDSNPFGVCSDGTSFWVTLAGSSRLARF